MKWKRTDTPTKDDEYSRLKKDNIKYGSLLVNLSSTLFLQSIERYKEVLSEEAIVLLEQAIRPNIETLREEIDKFQEALRNEEEDE